MQPSDSQKFAIARAHAHANGQGKTFILAFNQAKSESILCCPLEKLQKDRPYGLDDEDVFYRAEPGATVPAEIA